MPALYQTHAVLLKPSQKEVLLKAVGDMSGAVLRIPRNPLDDTAAVQGPTSTPIHLPLTAHQVRKMDKNHKKGSGTDLKISRSQIRHLKKSGAGGDLMNLQGAGFRSGLKTVAKQGLLGSAALASKLEPVATKLLSKYVEKQFDDYMTAPKKPQLSLKYGTGRPKKKSRMS